MLLRSDGPSEPYRRDSAAPKPALTAAPDAIVTEHARIRVQAGSRVWVRDLASGDSFLSSHDPRLHVGLGGVTRVDRLEVVSPSGQTTVLEDPGIDRYVEVARP